MSSLLEVYKDPTLTSRNPATLAKRAGVTVAVAKAFLRDREEAQVRKRAADFGMPLTYQLVTKGAYGLVTQSI